MSYYIKNFIPRSDQQYAQHDYAYIKKHKQTVTHVIKKVSILSKRCYTIYGVYWRWMSKINKHTQCSCMLCKDAFLKTSHNSRQVLKLIREPCWLQTLCIEWEFINICLYCTTSNLHKMIHNKLFYT